MLKPIRLPRLAALALPLLFAVHAQAAGIGDALGLSPFWDWKQIETEHFRVTFPLELGETAEKVANNLEDAYSILSRKLYWKPHYKAQILVIDNADAANGLTSPVLRLGIILYVTPPDNWFSTAYYDDWLRLLCFHEFTHFMNMDVTTDFWEVGRYLFGDVLLPNSVWPSWMLEGLAVYMETRLTRSGRGRSPYYEMILRAAVDAEVFDTSKFYTLDRVNGSGVPYFPGGEAVYLFGYELMNEVAKDNHEGPTHDENQHLKSGEDALGVMSERSGGRFPFFINGNLKKITGRDWYSYWHQFVKETRARAKEELQTIRSQPVSAIHPVTREAYEVMGSAFSRDGRWAAYTKSTLDERNGLYLRDLSTGKEKRLDEKTLGAQLAFTPDSKFILFSSLRRESEYYEFSEIGVYSLENNSTDFITSRLRARDPDVSRDGRNAVFTVAEGAKTSVAVAPIQESGGSLTLGQVRIVYSPRKFDAVAEPKFSADGRTVFFSLHRNGHVSEDLMAVDLQSGQARTLVENGKFNRFPAVTSRGDLLFVSDLSGVDNVYRYHERARPELVTNLTTGIAFPALDSQDRLYGSVLSYTGWDLARIDPLPRTVSSSAVTIAPAPGPKIDEDSAAKGPDKKYEIGDYSIFPSVWPRAWIPYVYTSPHNTSFGEAVAGFDAVDRHRYLVSVGYDTLSSSLDWLTAYQNRQAGATVTLSAGNLLSETNYSNGNLYSYTRDLEFAVGVGYPILWTYSALVPSLSFSLDRTSYFYPGLNTATANYDYNTGFYRAIDGVLNYSDAKHSKLAVAPEEGRSSELGARYYIDNGNGRQAGKALVADEEYFRFGKSHVVAIPSVKASYSSANPATNTNLNSNVVLQGHLPSAVGGFPNTSLSRLPIRGYSGQTFYVKSAIVSALDVHFPIADIFRGWGTNPFFLEQISGFVFAEATYLPSNNTKSLPSTGGGVAADLQFLVQLPLSLSAEYDYGFRKQLGGSGEFFVSLSYSGYGF